MTDTRNQPKPLNYDEAEVIAEDLRAKWEGITGRPMQPGISHLALVDIIQFIQRRAGEIIRGRPE